MKTLKFTIPVLFVAGLVALAYAQNDGSSHGSMMQMMGNGMMGNGQNMMGPGHGMMGYGNGMMGGVTAGVDLYLNNKDELKLTDQQVKALQKERLDLTKNTADTQSKLTVSGTELANLLDADAVNLNQVEKKVQEIEKLRSEIWFASIKSSVEARNILTPEQRETAKQFDYHGMHHETGNHMGGHMRGMGMMGSGNMGGY